MVSQGENLKFSKRDRVSENLAADQISQISVDQIYARVESKTQNESTQAKQQRGLSTLQKSMLPRIFSQLSLSVSWGALASTENGDDYEDEDGGDGAENASFGVWFWCRASEWVDGMKLEVRD